MEALQTLRELQSVAGKASDTPYRQGYLDALKEVEEIMLEIMWQRGEDDLEDE